MQSQSLREQNFGQAEGKNWSSAEWQTLPSGEDARTAKFADGESLEDVNARMATAVRRFVLPRVEALRKETSTINFGNGSAVASGSVPPDVTHIVIVAHGIAIAEILRVFMSLHDPAPPGTQAPWADPKLSYKRIRLENTGWTRIEIAVPAAGPMTSAIGRSMSAMSLRAPSGTGLITSPSLAKDLDAGQKQAEMIEGSLEASKLPPTAPTAGRSMFVRILMQNNIDHLKGFAMQPPTSGGPASLLGGGLAGDDSAAINHIPSLANVTTPNMPTSSLTPSRSPYVLTPNGPSARNLSAYDDRFLACEMEKASMLGYAGQADNSSVLPSSSVSGMSSMPSSSTLHSYNTQNLTPQAAETGAQGSDIWQTICIKVLPLFNGEGIKSSFDELNTLVS